MQIKTLRDKICNLKTKGESFLPLKLINLKKSFN